MTVGLDGREKPLNYNYEKSTTTSIIMWPLLFASCYVTKPGNIYINLMYLDLHQEITRTQGVTIQKSSTTQIISLSTRSILESKIKLTFKRRLKC